MIPLRLSVRNFLCYRDDVPPLDLTGIHVACLCGPNGHGKSALLDAMTWCLWGQARTGSRNHNFLIAYGETECRVELDFQAKGQLYRAIRRRRSAGQGRTELDLFVLDDAEQPRPITGNTVNETGARIRNLLGMDYDTFVNSAFLLQGRSDEFTRKTPSERKDVLSSILGLDLYEVLQAAARNKRSEWQDNVTRTEGALTQTRTALDELGDPTDELAAIERRLDGLAVAMNTAAEEARARQAGVEELRRKQADLSVAEQRIKTLRGDIARSGDATTALRQRIDQAKTLAERADEINAGATQLAAARDELERLESVRREYDRLHDRRNELQVAIGRKQATLSAESAELERRIREEMEPRVGRAESIAGRLALLADAEQDLIAEQDVIDTQSGAAAELQGNIAVAQGELERCVVEGKELRVKQNEMQSAGALCPLCRTPLTEDACGNIADWYESEIAAKLRQHGEIKEGLNGLTQQLEELSGDTDRRRKALARRQRQTQQERGRLEQEKQQSDDAAELLKTLQPRLAGLQAALKAGDFAVAERAMLDEIDDAIATLAYDEASREETYRLTQSLLHWEAERRDLDTVLSRLPGDEAEVRQNLEQLERWRTELADGEAGLSADRAAVSELPQQEQAAADADDRLARLWEERYEALARQGRLQSDVDRRRSYQTDIIRLESDHRSAQVEQGIYSDLFGAFGRSGVPAMLIDAAVPHLENEANHLLGRMTDNRMAIRLETQRDNRSGSTTETLDILISDELGSRNYELFSGGEAFRINLALRIALSKVLSQRLGTPLPTLFIDEGFGTQDAAGRERIVDAIASIQDEFEKIIVITHLDDLKDLFPARIEVLKTEAGSQFWLS